MWRNVTQCDDSRRRDDEPSDASSDNSWKKMTETHLKKQQRWRRFVDLTSEKIGNKKEEIVND